MEIGEQIGFMQFTKDTATSSEYGDFQIEQGVSFNAKAQTEQELLDSLALTGVIFNTMLKNYVKNGAWSYEVPYIITKKWNKGDKYEGNKRAKGNGFGVAKVKLPVAIVNKIEDFYRSKMSVVSTDEADQAFPEQEAPKQASGVRM